MFNVADPGAVKQQHFPLFSDASPMKNRAKTEFWSLEKKKM